MVCKCGHGAMRHNGYENECLVDGCSCPKFDLNEDVLSGMQPLWVRGAVRVFLREQDKQHDILERYKSPYILDVHSKEYIQHQSGAHGVEVALLIAEAGFDPRQWQSYRQQVLGQADRADALEKENKELKRKLAKLEKSSKRRKKNG